MRKYLDERGSEDCDGYDKPSRLQTRRQFCHADGVGRRETGHAHVSTFLMGHGTFHETAVIHNGISYFLLQ